MEKSHRIAAQIYGYAVCLVAVITFLTSVPPLVNSIIGLSDPWHYVGSHYYSPEQSPRPSMASFENYKMDVLKSSYKDSDASKAAYIPDDQTLHAMFEAAKADDVQSAQRQAKSIIIVESILVALSFMFFGMHWRWIRKLAKADA